MTRKKIDLDEQPLRDFFLGGWYVSSEGFNAEHSRGTVDAELEKEFQTLLAEHKGKSRNFEFVEEFDTDLAAKEKLARIAVENNAVVSCDPNEFLKLVQAAAAYLEIARGKFTPEQIAEIERIALAAVKREATTNIFPHLPANWNEVK